MTEPVTTPLRSDSSSTTRCGDLVRPGRACPSAAAAPACSSQSSPAPWNAPLDGVLALGLGPADVDAVDPDPVPAVGVGGVAGQPDQAGLGGDVRRQVGLAAVRRHGDDVDDRARLARGATMSATAACMRKNGASQVDRDVLVEQLGRGVEQRAAGGEPGGVDQAVDPAVRARPSRPRRPAPASTSATSAGDERAPRAPAPRSAPRRTPRRRRRAGR